MNLSRDLTVKPTGISLGLMTLCFGLLVGTLSITTQDAQARGYRGSHQSHDHYDYAQVVRATPIYGTQQVARPRQECWNEQVREYSHTQGSSRSSTGTLLGGIIGAAVGNELGHEKRNKQVGAVAGALLGASIGKDISSRRHHQHQQGVPRHRTQRNCKTVNNYYSQEVVEGYRIKYRYKGQTHIIRTQHHPGDTIKLRISATPVL